jgi:hypothetical protein
MLGWALDVPLAEKPGSIYSLRQHLLYARALPVAQRARLWMQQVLPEVWVPAGRFAAVNRGMLTDSSRWRGRRECAVGAGIGLEDWAANVTLRATSPR